MSMMKIRPSVLESQILNLDLFISTQNQISNLQHVFSLRAQLAKIDICASSCHKSLGATKVVPVAQYKTHGKQKRVDEAFVFLHHCTSGGDKAVPAA